MTVDDFVTAYRGTASVSVLCAAIGHKRSTYYARRRRAASARVARDAKLAREIAGVRRGYNHVRGRRNVKEALRRKGNTAGERRIGRVMRENGWYGTPRSSRPRPPVPVPVVSPHDLIQRQFRAEAPNQRWWGDVTEIPTQEGPLFLASLQDAFSRYIVGFAFSSHNDTELAMDALRHAQKRRPRARGFVHHTDQGSPYRSWTYQAKLEQLSARPSLGRAGKPQDNACIESWHSTLERELLAFNDFKTHEEAIRAITAWIHHFNRWRFHSTLGRLSPVEYERHHG